ncbi:unnamed protein product [Chilo suppressalis]|uniref:Major facilitator superfamily (MFS) profile domain-containing protein n=1 Tax=Chilo suppressalis TaxID=168631 RepID=A0ABN8BC87_CHISP|nr:unnamed protein product [Chilo suppressalis]
MQSVEEEPLKEKNGEPNDKNKEKKTFIEKIKYVKDNITLEPTLACYVVPRVLSRLATQNMNLDKACRVNMRYGKVVCDALLARNGTQYLKEELVVQEFIAAMESWKNILLTALPSFLILFLGAWSDRTRKRKICILMPIIGELLVCLSNIINVYYFEELPAEVAIFFEAFFPAITGSWISTYLGTFSYIGDISSKESRTFRVGVANLCLTAGAPIGSALSGVLLNLIGYYGVFSLSAVLNLFSILYGFYYIKDPEMPVAEKNAQNKSSSVWGFLKSFFDVSHVKATLQVAFKKGPNHRRTKSILILASIFFIYGPADGEFIVRYLFTRYRFNWDAMKYSFYNTFYILMHLLGALISISLFSRRWKWDDSVLGLISNVSKVIGALCTGLARNSLEMYIAVAVEMFNATSFTALRSISSKLVTSDELGKMTAMFNLMEIVTSLVFDPIYSWMYMLTLKIYPGTIYFVSTVLTIPPLMFFGWFYLQHRKTSRTKPKELIDVEIKKRDDTSKEKEDIRKNSLISSLEFVDDKLVLP